MKPYETSSHDSKTVNVQIMLSAIFITLVIASGAYLNSSFYKTVDLFFHDQLMAYAGKPALSDNIVIVDIDEISLSQAGQWPWPRYRLASLIQEIGRMHPQSIGLDILLSEPDRSALKNLKKQFADDFNLNLEFPGIPDVLTDNDAFLAHVLSQTNIAGARFFHFDHTTKSPPCREPIVSVQNESDTLSPHKATGALCNLFELEQGFSTTGFTNSEYDDDGILRRLPLLIQYRDRIYTHLALSTLLAAKGITDVQIKSNFFGPFISAGPYTIPINQDGEVLIRFSGPAQTHSYVSAVDLLNKTCSPEKIKNKIVLIGSSATGLNDIHHTPFDAHFPGIEVQAALIENIIENRVVITPIWDKHIVFLLCIAVFLAMAAVFIYYPKPSVLILTTLALIGLLIFSSLLLYKNSTIFISPGMPVVLALIHFSFFSFARFVLARQAAFVWIKKLAKSQQFTLEAMVSMVETRDPETGSHIIRTQKYAKALAVHLQKTGIHGDILTDSYIEMLFMSVPLHDIGKVGIPDRILLKEDKLTDEEFEIMKKHAIYGRQTIERAAQRIQGDNYLMMGAEIAGSHHERWNGTGYPEGFSGSEIPLSGRIMAICDVYDALISERCYKPPFSHEKSMEIIKEQKGKAFDPDLVDAFIAIEEQVLSIAQKHQDSADTETDQFLNN